MLNKQPKVRTHDDVITASQHYAYKWLDFVGQCPDLLNIHWFYEGANISDAVAIEMRRLISVLVMLYGTDLIRVILSVLDFELAKEYRNYIFAIPRSQAESEDMRIVGLEILLHILRRRDMRTVGAPSDLYLKFVMMMNAQKVDYFNQALENFSKTNLNSYIDGE